MITFLTVVYVAVCIFLILVVLLQAGRGGGMGAAFGGASQTVFGASGAGNFLTRLTVIMAALFMLLSATLAFISSSSEKSLQRAAAVAQQRDAARLAKEAKEKAAEDAKAKAAEAAKPVESAPIEATAVGAEEAVGAPGADMPAVQFVGADGKPIEGIKLERVEGKDLEALKAQGAMPLPKGAPPSPITPEPPAAPAPAK